MKVMLGSGRWQRRWGKAVHVFRTDGVGGSARLVQSWLERRRRSLTMRTLPRQVSVEISSYCNLRCPMCPRTIEVDLFDVPEPERLRLSIAHPTPEDADKHIPLPTFEHILNALPHVRELLLFSPNGESMLHPEFVEIMHMVGLRSHLRPIITTNATVIDRPRAESLVQHAFLVDLSIDGGSDAVYEGIRIGGDFQRTRNNVEDFLHLRGRKRYPMIDVNCVLQPENIDDLPNLFEWLKRIGIEYITLYEPHMLHSHVAAAHELNPAMRAAANAHAERGRAVGLLVRQSRCAPLALREQQSRDVLDRVRVKGSDCLAPWRTPHITLDGTVTPCWYTSTKQMSSLGNLMEQSFAAIWNGPAYRQLRQGHRPGDAAEPPEFCRTCPWLTTHWRHPEGDVGAYLDGTIN